MYKIVCIDGYYKDDIYNPFEDYRCQIGLDVDEDEDDNIFYYFESEQDVKDHMIDVGKGVDFIVTSYRIEEDNDE